MQEQARLRRRTGDAPGVLFRELMEHRLPPRAELEVAQHFYEALDTPISLSCSLLLKYGEHDQLVTKSVHPSSYEVWDADTFSRDFCAVSYLSKSKWLTTTFDKEGLALAGFKLAELRCRDTNVRLGQFPRETTNFVRESVLSRQVRKIDLILGKFDISAVLSDGSWGPGATLQVKGSDTSAARKFDHEREITRDAHALYGPVLRKAYPSWLTDEFSFVFVRGNEVGTVPKNAKIDRVVAPEPGINSWIQKGIGRAIRKRLRRAGYDLDSDTRNQRAAWKGSKYGEIATLDLKDASNSIAVQYVREVLPSEWYIPMDAARSKFYRLNGEWSESQMFSTMGNGFTFELESLLFLTLALACCDELGVSDEEVTIFGDDVVVPVAVVSLFTEMCNYCGFTLNSSKSFAEGPFRESCGAYYFNGVDVKPLFRKERMRGITSVYRAANSIRSLAYRWAGRYDQSYYWCDDRFKKTWNFIVHQIPKRLRLFGAPDAGDGVIHVDLSEMVRWDCHLSPENLIGHVIEERKPIYDRFSEDGWEGYCFPALVTIPVEVSYDSHGLLLSRLKASSGSESGNTVALRQTTRLYLNRRAYVRRWCNIGPWL